MMDESIGPFRLLREIGRGQNGAVYEAHDTRRDEVVALKVLQVGAAAGSEPGPSDTGAASPREEATLLRFVREADAIRRLQHPNIVRIRDAGADKGKLYIAMERLHGETLRSRLLQGPLSVDAAVDIALQVASALTFAHEQGITHRDVKPDNIYLLPDGTVKLMDFGAARVTGENSLTQTGSVIGSPAYMSPEQVSGAQVDGRTDVWGLAATLFEAVTGTKPFPGDSVAAVMYSILHKRPDFALLPHSGLTPVLEKALAKKPAARYASAAEFAEGLRCLPGPGCETGVRRQRSPLMHPVALLGGVLASLLLLAGLLLVRPRPDPVRSTVLVAPPASVPASSARSTRTAQADRAPVPPRPHPVAASPAVLVEEWQGEKVKPSSTAQAAPPPPPTAEATVPTATRSRPIRQPKVPVVEVSPSPPATEDDEEATSTSEDQSAPASSDAEAKPKDHPIPALPDELSEFVGDVRVRVDVDENGRVLSVSVADSSGNEAVDWEALRTVRRWRFTPAKKGGRAVASQTEVIVGWEE